LEDKRFIIKVNNFDNVNSKENYLLYKS